MKNISEDQVKAPEEKKHTPEQAADQRPFTAAVITLSDKGAKGQRVDESGPAAVQMLEEAGYEVREAFILPDEPERRHGILPARPHSGGNHGSRGQERAGNR